MGGGPQGGLAELLPGLGPAAAQRHQRPRVQSPGVSAPHRRRLQDRQRRCAPWAMAAARGRLHFPLRSQAASSVDGVLLSSRSSTLEPHSPALRQHKAPFPPFFTQRPQPKSTHEPRPRPRRCPQCLVSVSLSSQRGALGHSLRGTWQALQCQPPTAPNAHTL